MQILTRRFLLRDFYPEDEPALLAYHADPRYAEFYAAEEVTSEAARELLSLCLHWAQERPRRNFQLAIAPLADPSALLGCCGLRTAGCEPGIAELGIELAPQSWGRYRYAIEIMEALLEFGFRELQLREVHGRSIDANHRVDKLARRYGFQLAATADGPAWLQARGWRETEWRLSKTDWETVRATPRNRR